MHIFQSVCDVLRLPLPLLQIRTFIYQVSLTILPRDLESPSELRKRGTIILDDLESLLVVLINKVA